MYPCAFAEWGQKAIPMAEAVRTNEKLDTMGHELVGSSRLYLFCQRVFCQRVLHLPPTWRCDVVRRRQPARYGHMPAK